MTADKSDLYLRIIFFFKLGSNDIFNVIRKHKFRTYLTLNRSSVGPSFAKSRAVISFVVGLVFIAVGTGVTVSTNHTSMDCHTYKTVNFLKWHNFLYFDHQNLFINKNRTLNKFNDITDWNVISR